MTDDEAEVLAANAAFYLAFSRGNIELMRTLWSSHEAITVTHPGWNTLRGNAEVMQSWAALCSEPPAISHADASVFITTDTAVVTCAERLPTAILAATNVFVREGGAWRLVHHQAGPVTRVPAPESSALN